MAKANGRTAPRVAHLTAVHPPDDVRIFAKECRSLAAAGYAVDLVAPGDIGGVLDGVRLHGVPVPRGGPAARSAPRGCASRAAAVVPATNSPRIDESPVLARDGSGKGRAVCYAGGIPGLRGAGERVDAGGGPAAGLLLAGRFSPAG